MIGRIARLVASKFGYSLQKEYSSFLRRPSCKMEFRPEWLLSYLAVSQRNVTFIQIGANDGKRHDPIRDYVLKHKWKGLLIEPDPTLFVRLQENYKNENQLIFLNTAVGTGRPMEFFFIENLPCDAPPWANGIGSFRREVVLSHAKAWPDLPKHLRSQVINTIAPDAIFDVFPFSRVDLMLIDVEGCEHDIITNLSLKKNTPRIIYYENKHLPRIKHEKVVEYLVSHGYSVGVGARDSVALKRDYN